MQLDHNHARQMIDWKSVADGLPEVGDVVLEKIRMTKLLSLISFIICFGCLEPEPGFDGKDGADGSKGETGLTGSAGSSCSVKMQTDGSVVISCTDGTKQTIVPAKDPDPQCARRSGTYVFQVTILSGDCIYTTGDQRFKQFSEHMLDQPTTPPVGCSGFINYSSNNCTVNYETSCPNEDGTVSITRGTANWSVDGLHGIATETFSLLQGITAVCQSVNEVVARKAGFL
jgi:hypothetical protein